MKKGRPRRSEVQTVRPPFKLRNPKPEWLDCETPRLCSSVPSTAEAQGAEAYRALEEKEEGRGRGRGGEGGRVRRGGRRGGAKWGSFCLKLFTLAVDGFWNC